MKKGSLIQAAQIGLSTRGDVQFYSGYKVKESPTPLKTINYIDSYDTLKPLVDNNVTDIGRDNLRRIEVVLDRKDRIAKETAIFLEHLTPEEFNKYINLDFNTKNFSGLVRSKFPNKPLDSLGSVTNHLRQVK